MKKPMLVLTLVLGCGGALAAQECPNEAFI